MRRVVTALLLIPVVVWLIFWPPAVAVRIALLAVALLSLHEFYRIAQAHHPFRLFGFGAAAVVILAPTTPQLEFWVIAALVLMALSLLRRPEARTPLVSAGASILGVAYIAGPLAIVASLHLLDPHWLFLLLALNWAGDAAAYFTGRRWGRRPLAERISPKKTWEGTVASFAASLVCGSIYVVYLHPSALGLWEGALFSAVVNVSAQTGDLVESMMKREAGVKDSGGLLPGHGGMLDRLDGLLFSAPASYFLLMWMSRA